MAKEETLIDKQRGKTLYIVVLIIVSIWALIVLHDILTSAIFFSLGVIIIGLDESLRKHALKLLQFFWETLKERNNEKEEINQESGRDSNSMDYENINNPDNKGIINQNIDDSTHKQNSKSFSQKGGKNSKNIQGKTINITENHYHGKKTKSRR